MRPGGRGMARARTPVATSVRRLTQLLLLAFVVIHFVLPQVPKVRDALPLFGSIDLPLVLLAVAFEAASICSYTKLTASLIPRGQQPGFFTLLRIQLSTLAISHVVPGGSAAGGALGFRLLTKNGLRGTDAAFVMATQGMGSAVVLNIILWVGLVISIPLRGYNPLYAFAAVLGVLLIGGFSTLVVLVSLLTFFGAPVGAATLGVVLYRLVNFWLPIPLGALAYLSLQVDEVREEIGVGREARAEAAPPELRRRREEELRRLAEEAVTRAEDRRAWAERHGLRVSTRSDPSNDPAED